VPPNGPQYAAKIGTEQITQNKKHLDNKSGFFKHEDIHDFDLGRISHEDYRS
jgi:hypothetical protein